VKGGDRAKTRLRVGPAPFHDDLATAVALDSLHAAVAAVGPQRCLVVTSDPQIAMTARGLGAFVVADPGRGLNAAVRRGVAAAATGPVAALLADVPALRAEDLLAALDAAAPYPLAMVPDAEGTGTVLLCAREAAAMRPSFGPGSAARHVAQGYAVVGLDLPRLRRDVDDLDDLGAAQDLGLGARTTEALRSSYAGERPHILRDRGHSPA
jgi:2-phospho-L-lactate guanylyltransferase